MSKIDTSRICRYCGKELKSRGGDICSKCADKINALRKLRQIVSDIKNSIREDEN
mgnify:CR=1 FL=1